MFWIPRHNRCTKKGRVKKGKGKRKKEGKKKAQKS